MIVDAKAFKSGLRKSLLSGGFARSGHALRRDGDGVSVLIDFAKGFGNQWFVNVGFWLHALGTDVPNRTELTHMYYRLERLLPPYRETILAAGAIGDPEQPEAHATLIELLPGEVDKLFRDLGNEAGLRTSLVENRLNGGFIRKEARDFLMRRN